MIPRLGRQGSSFKGAAKYFLHDRGADTAERIAHVETRNLPTQDPELGWRVMAATAKDADRLKMQAGVDRRGRKLKKPVFTLSLSWSPDETPDHAHMAASMDDALARLGLAGHQAIYVVHNDAPHPHIHALLNVVNPENGRTAPLKFSKERLSKWAQEYEQTHGIKCEQRVLNNARRASENRRLEFDRASRHAGHLKAKFPRYKERELWLRDELNRCYRASDSGAAFRAAVRELGYELAQGKRIVLLDPDGNVHSLTRQLEGVSAADLRKRLQGITLEKIGDTRRRVGEEGRSSGEALRQKPASVKRPVSSGRRKTPGYWDRDADTRKRDDDLTQAAINHQKEEVRTGLLNRLQDAQHDRWGAFYEESAQKRHRLEKTIHDQYGSHEGALRTAIAARERKIAESSKVRSWFLKNFARENDALENDRMTLASIEQRKQEMRDALNVGIERRRQAIEAATVRERQHVQRRDLKPAEVDVHARSIESQQREAARAHARHVAAEPPPSARRAFQREKSAYLSNVQTGAAQHERAGADEGASNRKVEPEAPGGDAASELGTPQTPSFTAQKAAYLRRASRGREVSPARGRDREYDRE